MAKTKSKRSNHQSFQSAKGGRLIAIFDDMFKSVPGQELFKDAKAFQLYFLFLSKYNAKYLDKVLVSSNKNDISIPVSEYTQYMTQRTFEKCIDKLIELGFIKLIKSGYSTRECNVYGLNDMWQHYGTNKFFINEEWKRPSNREKNLKTYKII